MGQHLTVKLDDAAATAFGALAAQSGQPVEALVNEALAAWLDVQSGHLADIQAGLAEADRGEFVSSEDIAAIVAGSDRAR
jgi:predicted transcriptional regulator